MVDAYFHPMRMTYPIQPRPFFQAAPNWGKPAKLFLPRNISNRTDVPTVRSLHSSSISTPWGKPSNLWTSWVHSLRPRVPSWTWIRCIQSATHGHLHFASNLSHVYCGAQFCSDIQLLHPGQHFWRRSCFSPTTIRTTHSWVTTSFLPLTSKYDFFYTYGDHISLRHPTMP